MKIKIKQTLEHIKISITTFKFVILSIMYQLNIIIHTQSNITQVHVLNIGTTTTALKN